MDSIHLNGSNIFSNSGFLSSFSSSQDFEGRSELDSEFSFDGYRISGFADLFGSSRRYIRPSDRSLVFSIIVNS